MISDNNLVSNKNLASQSFRDGGNDDEASRIKSANEKVLDYVQVINQQRLSLLEQNTVLQTESVELKKALEEKEYRIKALENLLDEINKQKNEAEFYAGECLQQKNESENQYRILLEEYKDLEHKFDESNDTLNFHKDNSERLQSQLENITLHHEQIQLEFDREREIITNDSHKLLNQIQVTTQEKENLKKEIDTVTSNLKNLKLQRDKDNEYMKLNNEKIDELQVEYSKLKEDNQKLKVDNEILLKKNDHAEMEKVEIEKDYNNLKERLYKISDRYNSSTGKEIQEQINKFDYNLQFFQNENQKLYNRLERNEVELTQVKTELELEKKKNSELTSEMNSDRERLRLNETRHNDRERELSSKIGSLLENISVLQNNVSNLNKEYSLEKDSSQSQLMFLKEEQINTTKKLFILESYKKEKDNELQLLKSELNNAKKLLMQCETEIQELKVENETSIIESTNFWKNQVSTLEKRIQSNITQSNEQERNFAKALLDEKYNKEKEVKELNKIIANLELDIKKYKKNSEIAKAQLIKIVGAVTANNNEFSLSLN